MINREHIKQLFDEFNSNNEYFVVDINVSNNNKITLLIDKFDGIGIDECVSISRHIEGNLDREDEDFELEVSSPGLDHPLQVIEQYLKNVGRTLDLLTTEDKRYKGKLIDVKNDTILIEYQDKVKLENKKKKKLVTEQVEIKINNINKAKVVITFK